MFLERGSYDVMKNLDILKWIFLGLEKIKNPQSFEKVM